MNGSEVSMKQNREKVEWTNCWWSEANKITKRILLIGDSVTRSVRSCLERYMFGQYAFDLFAASFSIMDSIFWKHLRGFMDTSEYAYSCIIVQYGVQHGLYQNCAGTLKDKDDFKLKYIELLDFLKKYCSNIICMTNNARMQKPEWTMIDSGLNEEILCRNNIIKDVGKQFGVRVFDFYNVVYGGKHRYVDCVHLEKKAYIYLAAKLANFLKVNQTVCLEYEPLKKQMDSMMNLERGGVIIYGAGERGAELYCLLWLVAEYMEKTLNFVQTYLTEEEWCCGKRVMCIDDIPVQNRNSDTLIISSYTNYKDMKLRAEELGFRNIIRYEEIMSVLNK